jgi:hypothetical protein
MNEKLRLINKQIEVCVKLYVAHDYFTQEEQYKKLMRLCDSDARLYSAALRGFWMRTATEEAK